MSPSPHFLTLEDVVVLHDEVVEATGQPPSPLVVDRRGVLESALNRPRMLFQFEEADVARQAVALAVGISQAQAFVDGNKRAALAALNVFLRKNGLRYEGDSMDRALWLEQIAEDSENRDRLEIEFADWLRNRLNPFSDAE